MKKNLQKKTKEQLIDIALSSYELLNYIANKTQFKKVKALNAYIEEIYK